MPLSFLPLELVDELERKFKSKLVNKRTKQAKFSVKRAFKFESLAHELLRDLLEAVNTSNRSLTFLLGFNYQIFHELFKCEFFSVRKHCNKSFHFWKNK